MNEDLFSKIKNDENISQIDFNVFDNNKDKINYFDLTNL